MNPQTQRLHCSGPAGQLEVAVDHPAGEGVDAGVALICHPHPLGGGTMDNKVVQTLARAFVQMGYTSVRFNFRGVGASEGQWDEGHGEIEDACAVLQALPTLGLESGTPLALAGFSFGGYVAAHVAQRCAQEGRALDGLALVGPATRNFSVPTVAPDTLVIHGELDDVVPLQSTLDWARPQSLPVVVVPGGGHFFHGQLPLLKSLVMRHWQGRAGASF